MHHEAELRAPLGWAQDPEELSTVVSVIAARFAASIALSSQGAGAAASQDQREDELREIGLFRCVAPDSVLGLTTISSATPGQGIKRKRTSSDQSKEALQEEETMDPEAPRTTMQNVVKGSECYLKKATIPDC